VCMCCSDGVTAVISGLHAIFFIILGASLSLAETFSDSVSSTVFEVNCCHLVVPYFPVYTENVGDHDL